MYHVAALIGWWGRLAALLEILSALTKNLDAYDMNTQILRSILEC